VLEGVGVGVRTVANVRFFCATGETSTIVGTSSPALMVGSDGILWSVRVFTGRGLGRMTVRGVEPTGRQLSLMRAGVEATTPIERPQKAYVR